MKRRLVWINLALFALLCALGIVLRERWLEAQRREREILAATLTPGTAKLANAKVEPPAPTRAASYFEVAEKMLFAKDRNPTVVVEVAQAKPMPPLPAAFGVMDIGQGPVVFLAEKGGSQRGYKPGDTIGEFKLAAITPQELTFEWEGKTIVRKIEELRAETREAPASQPVAPAASEPSPRPVAQAPPATTTNATGGDPWGNDGGAGLKLCRPDDNTPAGTVVRGWKKVTGFSPMGRTCLWEEVK